MFSISPSDFPSAAVSAATTSSNTTTTAAATNGSRPRGAPLTVTFYICRVCGAEFKRLHMREAAAPDKKLTIEHHMYDVHEQDLQLDADDTGKLWLSSVEFKPVVYTFKGMPVPTRKKLPGEPRGKMPEWFEPKHLED